MGSYNPHTKDVSINKEKVDFYLKNGAQPTPRVVRILVAEKVELPAWVKAPTGDKSRATRKPEKLRKNQPKEEKTEEPAPEAKTPETPTES